MTRFLILILAVIFLCSSPAIAGDNEPDPDLTEVDDETALMDEFALLQEEEIVLSAAKHKQKIGCETLIQRRIMLMLLLWRKFTVTLEQKIMPVYPL